MLLFYASKHLSIFKTDVSEKISNFAAEIFKKTNYMTKYIVIIVLLLVAVVVLTFKAFSSNDKGCDNSNAVLENIMTRTSIRQYQDQLIEKDKIEIMLKAAMAAPSAVNLQPWRFVVITDKEELKQISDSIRPMQMVQTAPLAIVVCGDMNKTLPDNGRDYWVEDVSASTENLLLAAHGLGLGAVWCGVYPLPERVQYIQRLLDLPSDIVPLNVVAIGYPAESPEPKDKWDRNKVHYEQWGNQE